MYTLRPERPSGLWSETFSHSWNRIITPTRRSSEKSMEISGNGQGVFRNQPLPKIIRKPLYIPGVNDVGKGRTYM
jgi:hypothetical protein